MRVSKPLYLHSRLARDDFLMILDDYGFKDNVMVSIYIYICIYLLYIYIHKYLLFKEILKVMLL